MATAVSAPPSNHGKIKGVQPLRAGQGNDFVLRRLHSLTGIIPIGAFLIEHIISNFEIVNGPLAYAQQVKFLNGLPLARVLEWAFIFIPLAFHALYGVYIAIKGRANVNVYPWASNWMYLSQRVTGILALLYIIQHLYFQRFTGVSLPENPGTAYWKVQNELSSPGMLIVYILGMVVTVWHFAYGIWLFCAKWGITPGDRARKKFGYVCTVFGVALATMGIWSIVSIYTAPRVPYMYNVLPSQPNNTVAPTVPGQYPTTNYDQAPGAPYGPAADPNAYPQQGQPRQQPQYAPQQ